MNDEKDDVYDTGDVYDVAGPDTDATPARPGADEHDGADTLAALARDAGRDDADTGPFRVVADDADTGDEPDHAQLMAAARILLEARDAGLGTLLFGAMVDDLIDDAPPEPPSAPVPATETATGEPYPELDAGGPDDVPDAADLPDEPPEPDDIPAGPEPAPETDAGKPTATPSTTPPEPEGGGARDANAPETPDPRTSAQFGARARDTYYRNLPAFVQGFVAHVFAFQQSVGPTYRWVPDWWAHPQIVFPLDAMWRSYEAARKNPNGMMVFYIQAFGVLDRVFNPDRGIVNSLTDATEVVYTNRGEPLPCTPPPADWRRRITAQLAVGDDGTDTADGEPGARTHDPTGTHRNETGNDDNERSTR